MSEGLAQGVAKNTVIRKVPFWYRGLPYFLSAILFMSGFFAVFSPAPLMMFGLQVSRKHLVLALASNLALIAVLGGLSSLAPYVILVLTLVLFGVEGLGRGVSLEKTATLWLGFVFLTLLSILWYFSGHLGFESWIWLKGHLLKLLDQVFLSLPEASRTQWLGDLSAEEWKDSFLKELPGMASIIALVFVWINLIVVVRANPGHVREKLKLNFGFFQRWKVSEYLVWPTILFGFGSLFGESRLAILSLNILKFLLAIYAIQGLSILSFFFDVWRIKGIMRSFGFAVVLFLMMPLLLAIGFFDLWFDFRGKLRQS